MATVSGTFTGVGVSANLDLVAVGEDVTYTFSGGTDVIHQLEREKGSIGSGAWEVVLGPYTDDDGSDSPVVYSVKHANERLRARCTSYGSGTLTYSFSDGDKETFVMRDKDGNVIFTVTQAGITFPGTLTVDGAATVTGALTQTGNVVLAGTLTVDGAATITGALTQTGAATLASDLTVDGNSIQTGTTLQTGVQTNSAEEVISHGVGTVAGTGVAVAESGSGAFHKTVFTLTDVLIPQASITTAAGVGSIKIYDFPTGAIFRMGCTADLAITIAAAEQADFTDNTPEGDIGIGSITMANDDAFGTDATDDDWGTAQTYVMSAWADADVAISAEAAVMLADGGTDADLFLSALTDAGDIDDGVSSAGITVNGTITVLWANCGQFA